MTDAREPGPKTFRQALCVVLDELARARHAAKRHEFELQEPLDPFRLLDAVHQEQYRDVPPTFYGPMSPDPDPVAAERLELERDMLKAVKAFAPKREPWEERDDD